MCTCRLLGTLYLYELNACVCVVSSVYVCFVYTEYCVQTATILYSRHTAKTITGEPFQARYNFRSGGYNIPDYTAVDFLIAAAIGAVPCCSCLRIGFRSGED